MQELNKEAEVIGLQKSPLTEENFLNSVLVFRDRQAGVSLVFDGATSRYAYNAYCVEKKLLTELFSCEYEFLDDALKVVNAEFGTWELSSLEEKTGCGSCVAK